MTVHILRAGLALCGFNNSVPLYWPEGHKWVGLADIGQATCDSCLEKGMLLKEQSKDA